MRAAAAWRELQPLLTLSPDLHHLGHRLHLHAHRGKLSAQLRHVGLLAAGALSDAAAAAGGLDEQLGVLTLLWCVGCSVMCRVCCVLWGQAVRRLGDLISRSGSSLIRLLWCVESKSCVHFDRVWQ